MVLQVSYNIFNMCVSGNIENKFLIVEHQKRTLFAITEHCITTNEQFECVYYACENVIAHILLYHWKHLDSFIMYVWIIILSKWVTRLATRKTKTN